MGYTPNIRRFIGTGRLYGYKPLILIIDLNFQRDIQVPPSDSGPGGIDEHNLTNQMTSIEKNTWLFAV